MDISLVTFAEQLVNISFPGLVLALIVGNLFPGIPEEVFVMLIGSAVASGYVSFGMAFTAAMITLWTLDNVWYVMGRSGSRIGWAFYNKIFGVSFESNNSTIWKLRKKIVFWSRFAPYVRFIGPFTAGAIKMKWSAFAMWNAFALAVYIPIMLVLGFYFQDRIEAIVNGGGVFANSSWIALGVMLVLGLLIVARRRFVKWFKSRLKGEASFMGFTKRKREDSEA